VTSPEVRYRRLLALYPREFRREYEDEMLGVLMADSPGPAQVFDLVRSALAAHLSRPFAPGRDWRRAAWVVQVFGSMLMLAMALRVVAIEVTASTLPYGNRFDLDTVEILRVVGWSVALASALFGPRLIGHAGAVVGLVGEIGAPARYYLDTPAMVLYSYWLIVGAAVVLAAGLGAKRGTWPPRGSVPVAAAGVVLVLHGFVLFGNVLWPIRAALPWVAVALAGLGVWRLRPAVRRRVVAWAVPVVVTVPVVRVGFGGFIEYNGFHPESLRLLGAVQVAALVLVPVATFFVVAELNRRLEASRAVSRTGVADK